MRYGFTTGSCAAAAAKAAAYMLLTGKEKQNIVIETPKGVMYEAGVLKIKRAESHVSCVVRKDSGGDPDVTDGALIAARVSIGSRKAAVTNAADETLEAHAKINSRVIIKGGEGVGVVTKPGLDQPVGAHAINSVPRRMIEKEVLEVMSLCDYKGVLDVEISVPEGRALAEKTFNPRLGIEGGISILGTSGIVEPMSSEAIIKTIEAELRQKKALGYSVVPVSPGNYGLEFMKREYGFDLELSVKCSNFIGEMLDMAAGMGFEGVLLTGHIGKLIKVSGGMMNTHSKYGDCRMELIAAAAALEGAENKTLQRILGAVSTEDAVDIIDEGSGSTELRQRIMDRIMDRIMQQLNSRIEKTGAMQIECMMYSNRHGMLAMSKGATDMLAKFL